ncbi:MAG: DMT family transporter [Fimbriimonadaceae bacterium]|nr:DMT family transporter [Fimbriimonadaceae bacterium]
MPSSLRQQPLQRFLGLLAMASACAIWGLGPIWIRGLLTYLPALDICLFRVLLGGLTIAPALCWYDRARLRAMLRQPAVWLGSLAMASSMLAYAAALNFIRPAEVNLLFQANILVAALLGRWLYHESIPRRRWICFVAVLLGVALVILSRDAGAGRATGWLRLGGMALGILGGVGASCVQASLRNLSDLHLGIAALVPMHVAAAVLFYVSAGGQIVFHRPPDARCYTLMLLLGIFGSGVGSLLVAYAIRRISLAQAGVTGSMQPTVTILVTALYGDLLSPQGLLGAALVISGVVASALLEREVIDLRATHPHRLSEVVAAEGGAVEVLVVEEE